MSTRNKKRQQPRRPVRPESAEPQPGLREANGLASGGQVLAGAATGVGTSSLTSGVIAPRRPTAAAAAALVIDIDARVPYFTSDLSRILVTAAAMLAIILIASFLLR